MLFELSFRLRIKSTVFTLQINRRMEFVFASHSFDVWENWTLEGPLDECRLVNCRNPLVILFLTLYYISFFAV